VDNVQVASSPSMMIALMYSSQSSDIRSFFSVIAVQFFSIVGNALGHAIVYGFYWLIAEIPRGSA
jgi:hypothetical protein